MGISKGKPFEKKIKYDTKKFSITWDQITGFYKTI